MKESISSEEVPEYFKAYIPFVEQLKPTLKVNEWIKCSFYVKLCESGDVLVDDLQGCQFKV
jgi:hypothetical protein